ncbi:MAG TPA: hypothetical protein VMY35_13580 [Phycisphaerae bacterium]|nr:hypothetical protein [Phycisphaerae bacterium]
MNPSMKQVVQVLRTALTAAGTELGSGVTNYIDTLGYDFMSLDCICQTYSGTMSTFQIMEADVTTSATFAAIVALTGGTATSTSAGFVIASSPTAGQYLSKFNVDLRGRKRYVKLALIPDVAVTATVVANLFKGEDAPITTTQVGVTNFVAA